MTQKAPQLESSQRQDVQFHQLADAMPHMVWAAQPDGFIDYYNERWYEFSRLPRSEYGLQNWETLLHPDDFQRYFDAYFEGIKAEKSFEIEHRFKDQRTRDYRWFSTRAVPVRDDAGQVVRWFGTCTDIDELKKANKRQNDRLRLLWEAATVLLTTDDPDAMLGNLFKSIAPHFELDTYFNFLVTESGESLRLVDHHF